MDWLILFAVFLLAPIMTIANLFSLMNIDWLIISLFWTADLILLGLFVVETIKSNRKAGVLNS